MKSPILLFFLFFFVTNNCHSQSIEICLTASSSDGEVEIGFRNKAKVVLIDVNRNYGFIQFAQKSHALVFFKDTAMARFTNIFPVHGQPNPELFYKIPSNLLGSSQGFEGELWILPSYSRENSELSVTATLTFYTTHGKNVIYYHGKKMDRSMCTCFE